MRIPKLFFAVFAALPLPAATVTLYSEFTLGPTGSFTPESITLTAANWHIGAAAGATPTDAVFAAVLGSLTDLEIGGHGTPSTVGNTTASWGFALSNPNLGGLVSDTFPVTSFQSGWTGAGWICCGWGSVGGNPGGYINGYD